MPLPAPPESPHDLIWFVSCVDGKPVTRLSLRPGPRQLIGAERGENRAITYYPDAVVGLTRAEVEAFGKEYQRTIDEGNLRRRTRDEWEAHRAAQKKRQSDELAKIKAAQEAADKAATEAARNGTAAPSGGAVS
jgi:hypothetical protein